MDIPALAQLVTATVAPALPYLLKLGDKSAEEIAKKIGADAWENAKALWAKIHPAIAAKSEANAATVDAAQMPDDEDARAALRFQIKKLLTEDAALANELASFVAARQEKPSTTVVVSGDRAVGIGGNMSGGSISTGDIHPPQQ